MTILWDSEDDPVGNFCHILEHLVRPEEVEAVLLDPNSITTTSRSSGYPITFGYTMNGRYLAVVWKWEEVDIRPITAYEVPKPRTPRKRRSK